MTRDTWAAEHGSAGWTARLSAYLDGEVTGDERSALDAHLAGCEACRALLGELRTVTTEASAMRAEDDEPAANLWPGIEERLRPRGRRRRWLAALVPGAPGTGTAWLRPALAAAALVVAVAAGYLLLPGGEPAPAPATAPVERAADGSTPAAPPPASNPAAPPLASRPVEASQEYYDTLARLQKAARVRLAHDPRVVEVLEENLEVLDAAIAQYADALAEQPDDRRLAERLDAARQRKIAVLQQAVDLAAEAGN